jgi:hypothetical protein
MRIIARSAGAVADVRVAAASNPSVNSASAVIVRAFSNNLYSGGEEIVYLDARIIARCHRARWDQ